MPFSQLLHSLTKEPGIRVFQGSLVFMLRQSTDFKACFLDRETGQISKMVKIGFDGDQEIGPGTWISKASSEHLVKLPEKVMAS